MRIEEALKNAMQEELDKGNDIFSVSFEIKVSKGMTDGINNIKTIALTVENPNKAF